MKMNGSLLAILAAAWLGCSVAAAQESATSIVEKADQLMRGKTQQGVYSMKIIRPDWQRSIKMKFWSEGLDKSFVLILEPPKEKGVTFLKIKNEMWNYIPRINRVIKIPPSMMLQSWMGSDFSNDDLVKESSVVHDYTHKLLGREKMRGFEAYKVELVPKPEAAVVWGKIIEWIRVKDYVPLQADYYNERGERLRTIIFDDIKKLGGRVLPAKMELHLEKKPKNITYLILEEVLFDKPIPKSVFSMQNLRRAKP